MLFCVEFPICSNAIRSVCTVEYWFYYCHFAKAMDDSALHVRDLVQHSFRPNKNSKLWHLQNTNVAMFFILLEYIVHCQGRNSIKFRNIRINVALQLIAFERASCKLNRVPLLFRRDDVNSKTNAYFTKQIKQTNLRISVNATTSPYSQHHHEIFEFIFHSQCGGDPTF